MVLDLGFGHTFPSFSNFHLIRPVSFCFEAPQVMISASKAIAGLLAMARNSNIDSKEAAARAMFYSSSHASGVQAIAAAGLGDGFVMFCIAGELCFFAIKTNQAKLGKQTSVKGIRTISYPILRRNHHFVLRGCTAIAVHWTLRHVETHVCACPTCPARANENEHESL
jgi:hypothetical protein